MTERMSEPAPIFSLIAAKSLAEDALGAATSAHHQLVARSLVCFYTAQEDIERDRMEAQDAAHRKSLKEDFDISAYIKRLEADRQKIQDSGHVQENNYSHGATATLTAVITDLKKQRRRPTTKGFRYFTDG